MAFACALVGAAVLGFMAGLVAFKTKDRWCPSCGETTVTLRARRDGEIAR